MIDSVALLVLALVLAQGVVSLLAGVVRVRQRRPMGEALSQAQKELIEWGLLPSQEKVKTADLWRCAHYWRSLSGRSRIGMGVGVLLAAGVLYAVLRLLAGAPPISSLTPPTLLDVALVLQGYALGMFAGSALGLLVPPARRRGSPAASATMPADGTGGSPAASATVPAGEAGSGAGSAGVPAGQRRVSDYRLQRLAVLPGALLLGDLLLIGSLDLFSLPHLTSVELWTLGVFPGLMLLICALGEWAMRRLARVSLPPFSPDAALARRADTLLRARMIALLLEQEIFCLFILVACQWLLRAFSYAHSGGFFYNGLPLVSLVILLSLRGLLERAQQQFGVSQSG